jgi:hypothetical protein
VTARRAIAASCVAIAACAPVGVQAEVAELAFVGAATVPTGFQFQASTVGGLSGISYDPDRQLYYLITDDKSDARFYTMRIPLTGNAVGTEFVGNYALQNVSGRADPEDIAFDRQRQQLYWSSEGDESWIRVAGLDGSYRGEFALAPTPGPRFNAGLEGLTVTPSGTSLWAAMEHPGRDDGEPPTERDGALTRITQFDLASRTAVAQYAYPLDPITAPSGDATGLTALVALDEDTFLTLERSHGTSNVARVYRAEASGADNVLNRQSLLDAPSAPMSKELVADLSTTPGVPALDNLEGITLGPTLLDGSQSVVLVSDNNFNREQVTQILAFAM